MKSGRVVSRTQWRNLRVEMERQAANVDSGSTLRQRESEKGKDGGRRDTTNYEVVAAAIQRQGWPREEKGRAHHFPGFLCVTATREHVGEKKLTHLNPMVIPSIASRRAGVNTSSCPCRARKACSFVQHCTPARGSAAHSSIMTPGYLVWMGVCWGISDNISDKSAGLCGGAWSDPGTQRDPTVSATRSHIPCYTRIEAYFRYLCHGDRGRKVNDGKYEKGPGEYRVLSHLWDS